MSGGYYGYFSFKLNDFVRDLKTNGDPRRIAFKELLSLVANACHDIEWVDSADYAPGDEHEAIDKVFDIGLRGRMWIDACDQTIKGSST